MSKKKNNPALTPSALINISTLSELCRKYPQFNHLLKEWHPTRNRDLPPYNITLTPDSLTPTDTRLVWWQCKKGHNWNESVADRVRKVLEGNDNGGDHTGCPFCQPEKIERAPILWDYCTSDVPDGEIDCFHLLDEWDYEKNYPLTPKDVKTVEYRKVWWKCSNGHSWEQLISNRVKVGVGCPYCGHRRVLKGFNDLATLFPEIAAEWDYEKNELTPDQVTSMTNKRVWWKCKHGHSYQKIVSNRTQHGQGCPVCRALAGEKGSMLIPGVNDLATTHPEIAVEWNHERNGELKPCDVKAGTDRRVWWKCKHGHEWETPVARRTGKRKIGCPGCSGSSTYKKFEDMGCVKGFEHFGQGQGHVWRKRSIQDEKTASNVDITPNVKNPTDEKNNE